MEGSLSVTHVTNYKIKTEYTSLTCTRMHLRAPIFQIVPYPPPPYFKILYQSLGGEGRGGERGGGGGEGDNINDDYTLV